MSGLAKMSDFMPEMKSFEVFGKADGTKCIIYMPASFCDKRCEIFPNLATGKMIVSILPKNYDGGVKIQKGNMYGNDTAYVQLGRKWCGAQPFKIDNKSYLFDGKKFTVDINPYTPDLKEEEKPPATEPVNVVVEVERLIQMNENPKRIAIACVRQLNKFADDYGYRFVVKDNKVSMVPGEIIE